MSLHGVMSSSCQNDNSDEEIIFHYGHSTLRPLPTRQTLQLPEETNVDGCHYAVSSKKGSSCSKKIMEDTNKAMTVTIVLPAADSSSNFRKVKASFFGVFDGHGGTWRAPDFVALNIGHNILHALVQEMEEQSHKGIVSKDDLLNKKNLEQAVRAGYLKTDEKFLKEGFQGGSTCVTALIIDGNLVVSNVGDSRAVICIKSSDGDGGEAQELTRDHKPDREDERKRIEELGGSVTDCRGVWRVGTMAVSRAIGDRSMKTFLSAEPETKVIEIKSDYEFIILASDGLWDVVTNQEAVDIVRPFYCQDENGGGGVLLGACKKLVELAIDRKSKDDITVMIVRLHEFCKQGKAT